MSISIQRLQRADRLLGPAALALLAPLRAAARRDRAAVKRILVMKFWGIGSLQLMTPAVRALRERFPGARIELLTLRQNRGFAEATGVFDGVTTLDVGGAGWARLFFRIAALVLELRRRRYDAAFDFEFLTRFSAVVALLSGAPARHGFVSARARRGAIHTVTVPFRADRHVAENFLGLVGAPDAAVAASDLVPPRIERRDRVEAACALLEAGLEGDGPLVVLNPNAGALALERRWPAERFSEVARALLRDDGARIALIGTADERGLCAEIAAPLQAAHAGRVADLAGRLSMGGLAALLVEARAFLTNDSGPMHVAAALGVPTIALFGPETPVAYGPIGARATWLWRPPSCSPCINVDDNKRLVCCRESAECMTAIDVRAVLRAVRAELPKLDRTVSRSG